MQDTKKVLFDLAHNEILDIQQEEFSEFLELLESLHLKVETNTQNLEKKVLRNVDILVIGCPVNDYFSSIEIKSIVNFVRNGGNLLLLSEYGGDFLQKTNLNDITAKNFGVYIQNNVVKEINESNKNCSSILSIQNLNQHKITDHIREIVIGGACSLLLNKNSEPLVYSSNVNNSNNVNKSWTEIYNDSTEQWTKEKNTENEKQVIAAFTEFGKGKVVILGDIDIFTNDPNIGLNLLDNRKFVLNSFSYLLEPVSESSTIVWTLNQLGVLQTEIKGMNNKIINIIETVTILERRISAIEGYIFKENEDFNKDSLENEKLSLI